MIANDHEYKIAKRQAELLVKGLNASQRQDIPLGVIRVNEIKIISKISKIMSDMLVYLDSVPAKENNNG